MSDIVNSRNDSLLSGSSSADSISNTGSNVTINAGAGNDSISNWGSKVTVNAGDGNDYVETTETLVVVNGGSGNDTVYNWGSNVTINGGNGNDSLCNDASLAVIDGGAGTDSIFNWGSNVTINGGAGDDYIYNNNSNVTVNGGAGNDTVYNWNPNATINVGAGDDSVRNQAKNVLLQTEGGTISLLNYNSKVTVKGTTADELISVSSSYDLTINGGGGNDTVIADYDAAEVIQYSGGELLIENYNYDDTLKLESASIESYSTDGGNLIFNMLDGGAITLKNMTNHAVTVRDAKGKTSKKIYSNGYSPLEVIQNFMKAFRYSPFTDSTAYFNEAIKACSGFGTIKEVINQMISDRKAAADTQSFLKDYCGIILDNADTGAIIGWDAGGLTAKDASSIMSETTSADTLSSLTNATFTKGGLVVTYPQDESDLSTDQKSILQNSYRWWFEKSAELIEQSYGLTFDNNAISFSAVNDSVSGYWGLTSGNQYGNDVSINAFYTEFANDADLDANNVDRCIAHELTHVAQNLYLKRLPQFLCEGMAELTGGIDDMRKSSISLAASSASSLSTYLNINNYRTGNAYYYATGYMFWRYLAKQASDAYDSLKAYAFSDDASLDGTSSNDTLTALGTGLTVNAGAGNDTLTVYGQNEMILGGNGNDSIHLSAAAAGTTVNGGAGNDTVYAVDGEGSRVYEFASDGGRDVINGYSSNDTIHVLNGAEYSTVLSNNDLIVNVGVGRLTLKDAAAQTLNIVGRIVNDDNKVKVSGTTFADYIINSGSNVTIQAGGGDDTITGSDYGEQFWFSYASGDDLITNFGVNDTLKATSRTMSYKTVGDDVVVSIKKNSSVGTITLAGAGQYDFKQVGSYLNAIDTINNTTNKKKVSGSIIADRIINSASNVIIQAGGGDDTITGSDYGEQFWFSYASGDDLITNFGVNDTLKATSGTMTYKTVGDDVVVSIKKNSSVGTITLAGAGQYDFKQVGSYLNAIDTINNTTNKKKVSGSIIADRIINSASNVTIQAGGGDDTITGSDYGEQFWFSYASGDDLITNFGVNDTLKATSGTMTYKTVGDDVVVSIKKNSSVGTITLAGAGQYDFKQVGSYLNAIDTINNTTNKKKVSGSIIADHIINSASNVTIQAGGGDDTITGSDYGEQFWFSYASGDDLITNFGVNDTLKATSGTMTYKTVGDDVVVSIKKNSSVGTITLQGAEQYDFKQVGSYLNAIDTINNTTNKKKVSGSIIADRIINSASNVTIQAGGGDDTITGSDKYGEQFWFSYASGDDLITNFGVNDTLKATSGTMTYKTVGDDVVVSIKKNSSVGTITLAGAGQYDFKQVDSYLNAIDTINNTTNKKKVSGSIIADRIINSASNVTIQAGGGDDTITGSDYGEQFWFSYASGDDLITNFGVNDTLRCTSGEISSVKTSGDDVVVTLKKNSTVGTITLQGSSGYTFKKSDAYLTVVDTLSNDSDGIRFIGTSGDDYIVNSGKNVSINGGAGNDTIKGTYDYGDVFLFNHQSGDNVITNFGRGENDFLLYALPPGSRISYLNLISKLSDTIMATAGTISSVEKSGNDHIVVIESSKYSSTVTLKNTAHYQFDQSDSMLTASAPRFVSDLMVTGTASNDYIYLIGSNLTVDAGRGNDTIVGSVFSTYLFNYASGDDLITNFGVNDTLKATSGTMSYKTNGDDVIVSIKKNSSVGTITLQGAATDYTFKQSGAYLTATAKSTSAQLPAEDQYWFMNDATVEESELNEIVSTESAVDLPTDFMSDVLNRKTDALITVARHRFKK